MCSTTPVLEIKGFSVLITHNYRAEEEDCVWQLFVKFSSGYTTILLHDYIHIDSYYICVKC